MLRMYRSKIVADNCVLYIESLEQNRKIYSAPAGRQHHKRNKQANHTEMSILSISLNAD
jgi:hypothetical protein